MITTRFNNSFFPRHSVKNVWHNPFFLLSLQLQLRTPSFTNAKVGWGSHLWTKWKRAYRQQPPRGKLPLVCFFRGFLRGKLKEAWFANILGKPVTICHRKNCREVSFPARGFKCGSGDKEHYPTSLHVSVLESVFCTFWEKRFMRSF